MLSAVDISHNGDTHINEAPWEKFCVQCPIVLTMYTLCTPYIHRVSHSGKSLSALLYWLCTPYIHSISHSGKSLPHYFTVYKKGTKENTFQNFCRPSPARAPAPLRTTPVCMYVLGQHLCALYPCVHSPCVHNPCEHSPCVHSPCVHSTGDFQSPKSGKVFRGMCVQNL